MHHPSRQNPWLVCLLPFVAFMLAGSFEPSRPPELAPRAVVAAAQHNYALIYSLKMVLTLQAMIFVWPGYRQYPRRLTFLAVVVGLIGAGVWIRLAVWQHGWMPELADITGIEWFRSLGQRSGFDLLAEKFYSDRRFTYAFFFVRILGLGFVVPVIEEFFLRGFLMRFMMKDHWWEVPFGEVNRTAVIVGTLAPVLMHSQEAVAALVWFSAVTWLMVRTRSIWNCVVAHSITNLLLGLYVARSDQWWLM
jgi:CAAX prenyl protease-like protein